MPVRELEIVFLAIPWMKENRNVGLSWVPQAVMLIFGASWSPVGRDSRELHPASKRTSGSEHLRPVQATHQTENFSAQVLSSYQLYFNSPAY